MPERESAAEEHVRLNPDLVRASGSDLRELAGHGEAAAAKELERRKRIDMLLASEVRQVRDAVMAFENSVSQEPCYESAEEVVGAAYALEEAVETLSESAKALRDKYEEEEV